MRKIRVKYFSFEILTSLMRFSIIWLTKNKESKNKIFLIWEFLRKFNSVAQNE